MKSAEEATALFRENARKQRLPGCLKGLNPRVFYSLTLNFETVRPNNSLPCMIPFLFSMASLPSHIHFFFIFFLPFSAIARTTGNISSSSSLSATGENFSWISPSGDFAFGFRQIDSNQNQFLLSIWYAKIPERTIIWYANGDRPAPRGSKLELTARLGLVLNDPDGNHMWSSSPIDSDVSYGFMNDTGNFVLMNSSSNKLWEAFNHPTDTLLPAQRMEKGGSLLSRRTENSFSKGRFQLRFPHGNLILNTINLQTNYSYDDTIYYSSHTSDAFNSSNSKYSVIFFSESGYMYISMENGTFRLTEGQIPSVAEYYHRVTLAFDGVLRQYYRRRNSAANETWIPIWSVPENICVDLRGELTNGACGYNSICRIGENSSPVCECPQGFSWLDPNDKYGSCKPDFSSGCNDDIGLKSVEEIYNFVEMSNTDWPFSDYELLKPSNIEDCKNYCLHDCFCSVAIFRNDSCWKKKLPLYNGRVDNSESSKAFIKYRKDSNLLGNSNRTKKNNLDPLILGGSILLGSSMFVNFILIIAICLGFAFIYRKKKVDKIRQGEKVAETNLRCFTYSELLDATNDFSEELGRGAFGIVYKGIIQAGFNENCVAVKKLDKVSQDGEKEFKTEVIVIGQTYHKNLVKLIGYCNEGLNRLLVYEYLTNGSLSSFLFGKTKPDWNQRVEIALGIARGLSYLHDECSTQIIHCDIKPQNILLDDYHNARISDFGLAKVLMLNQSETQTAIRGTRGYVAPEWFRNMAISVKVDVYSFGVLLLEIICCQKSVDMDTEERMILADWAYDYYRGGKVKDLVEGDAESNEKVKIDKFFLVAIWCIQEDPFLRPTMRKVIQMLEGVVEVPSPPSPYSFNSVV